MSFNYAKKTRPRESGGQMFETKAEAKAKSLRPRPRLRSKLWGWGQDFDC